MVGGRCSRSRSGASAHGCRTGSARTASARRDLPTGGGRAQEPRQGGDAPGPGRQGPVHACAGDVFHPGAVDVRVIPFAAPLPTPWGDVDMVVANLAGGVPLHSGFRLARRVRHSCWRGGRRTTSTRCWAACAPAPDDLVRDRAGMSTVAVLLLVGNVTLTDVIAKQSAVALHVECIPRCR